MSLTDSISVRSTLSLADSRHAFDVTDQHPDIVTESGAPVKKSKAELEQLVKANGAKFYQTNSAAPDTICIADRSTYP